MRGSTTDSPKAGHVTRTDALQAQEALNGIVQTVSLVGDAKTVETDGSVKQRSTRSMRQQDATRHRSRHPACDTAMRVSAFSRDTEVRIRVRVLERLEDDDSAGQSLIHHQVIRRPESPKSERGSPELFSFS